uniref:Uncharacterized protein n=1 Tax=uncultured Rhizobiales bacterium HF4000_32B18 TaxID=710780 RepID=E0XWD0_9HYPH|nr:hypothetical protein [uncultured Rhizobiales bacterium HF4000_32B18]
MVNFRVSVPRRANPGSQTGESAVPEGANPGSQRGESESELGITPSNLARQAARTLPETLP